MERKRSKETESSEERNGVQKLCKEAEIEKPEGGGRNKKERETEGNRERQD